MYNILFIGIASVFGTPCLIHQQQLEMQGASNVCTLNGTKC